MSGLRKPARETHRDPARTRSPRHRRDDRQGRRRRTHRRAKQDSIDTALEKGWPISTGSVEGACKHLIDDRLDITGARWGLTGAEAVLKLRAVHANGDLDSYLAYHHTREHQRTYPDQHHYQLGA